VPLSDSDKSSIYSNPEVKSLLRDLGFIEELGEFMLDQGIKNKMKKIKKWLKKEIKKVKKMMLNNTDDEELIDGIVNDRINVEEM
jgi:hypothetical protein